jgi:hypothetical protein
MKYEPASKDKQGQGRSSFDSLSYRDKDGNFFYEPTTEISLVKDLQNGWFAVVLVPTNNWINTAGIFLPITAAHKPLTCFHF